MLLRATTVAGAAALAVAGPLLAVTAHPALGTLGSLAVLAAWFGIGAVLAAQLLTLRANHRLLRAVAARTRTLDAAVATFAAAAPTADVVTTALQAGLTAHDAALDARLGAHRDELLATLDARILGLHALVRELTSTATS